MNRDLSKLKYRYVVASYMCFPTDMLRYDHAIVVGIDYHGEYFGRPILKYIIHGETKPTKGRWESFAYNIVGKVEKL